MPENAGASRKYPTLAVRVSQLQLDRWEELASARGTTLAKLVRETMDREARQHAAGNVPAGYRTSFEPDTF